MTSTSKARLAASFQRWFRTPPRLHGEIDHDRTVSYLELFYDLVFVVIVARLAHHLAGHTTLTSVLEFGVLFGLMWVAWMNGSLYHELHGREDGRHRAYIFAQMFLLMLLAVFAGHAVDSDGRRFALTYCVLMVLITYQWWLVSRLDTVPQYRRSSRRYVIGMVLVIVIALISAYVSNHLRLALWGVIVALTTVGYLTIGTRRPDGPERSPMQVTDSMVERFGLFTIIVLGEVVTGVLNGILDAEATTTAIVVGILALNLGFGLWWNYFDALGRKLPRDSPRPMIYYLLLHLPLHASVAAAGAGMVGLIDHADAAHLDAGTTWLLTGSIALVLVLVAAILATLNTESFPEGVSRYQAVLIAGALLALSLGLFHLRSWELAVGLGLVLGVTWGVAFVLQSLSGAHEHLHAAQVAPEAAE